MAEARLTRRAIQALRYDANGAQQQILWDRELAGFGCRVYPSGAKTYVALYRATRGRKGRQRLYSLGSAFKLTLDQARSKARGVLVDVLSGADPAQERERERRASTVADLAAAYCAKTASRKRSADDDAQRVRDHIVPAIGTRLAISVTRADVAALHQRVADSHSQATANRVLALLSAIYSWGERVGALPEANVNPVRGVERFKEHDRERWLTREEARRLLMAVEQYPSVYFRAFVWLALLTAARKEELLAARWDQVSFEERTLRLPRTKSGRVHRVPLSQPALQVLERMPRMDGNPHLFPGARRGGHLVNVAKPWATVLKQADVTDCRLHDLRRTAGSWMAQSGHSLAVIGSVLNHANLSTTQVYSRLADPNRAAALESHGQALLEAFAPAATERWCFARELGGVSVRMAEDGAVLVTAPQRITLEDARWLRGALDELLEVKALTPAGD